MRKIILYSLLGAAAAFLATVAYAGSYQHEGKDFARVNRGDPLCIKDTAYGVTLNKKVTNNCSWDIFVPTKTSGEWGSFDAHHPNCVTIESCAIPPPPNPTPPGEACTFCYWWFKDWNPPNGLNACCQYWWAAGQRGTWDANKDTWFLGAWPRAWNDDINNCRTSSACSSDPNSYNCRVLVARAAMYLMKTEGHAVNCHFACHGNDFNDPPTNCNPY